MFDEEVVNSFSGGFRISEAGICTIFGLPSVSTLRKVISFPLSLSIHSLVRKNETVRWKGTNFIDLPPKASRLTNAWYDPLVMMMNIALQRGWTFSPYILADEQLRYNLSLGYYSAFVDLVVESFAQVNGINLSTSELVQISSEIQDKIKGENYSHETATRRIGKEGNILIYDKISHNYSNEPISFEPYSLILISENSLETNHNFLNFQRNFRKFKDANMRNRSTSSLSFPFVGIRNHIDLEEKMFELAMESFRKNDIASFISAASEYSKSLGYNLGVLSDSQKTIAKFIEKYKVSNYIFNVSEYSGSVLVFADSEQQRRITDNVIRDYYNLTNRTIRIDEINTSSGSKIEPIRV